jgi:hypothetical protein
MLILGIGRLHDPLHMTRLFKQRFDAGQYSGISGVLLLKSATSMEPPVRTLADFVGFVRNERTDRPLPDLPLATIGALGTFIPRNSAAIPAYRSLTRQARVGGGPGELLLPDLQDLQPGML